VKNSRGCIFLYDGAYKSGGLCLLELVLYHLEVGASYECIFDIYMKKFHGFLPFGFPRKFGFNVCNIPNHP
jgi:hypothetical protein